MVAIYPPPPSEPERFEPASHDFTPNRRLDLEETLHRLGHDGWLHPEDAQHVRTAARGSARAEIHPLVLIANAKVPDARHPGTVLQLEALTEWLAGHARLPHLRIDPTRIDVAAVGQVVTPEYASRYRILPIALDAREICIATSEPFDTRWLADLTKLLRRNIKRVVANPLDVNRYLMEFYGVTRSVARARDEKARRDTSKILNLEQLIEIGATGDLTADDQHVVRIVDWLLSYAHEQRASDIHLEPRRDVSRVRFRIDGVLHKVFELPTQVMGAVVARIKTLGRMDIAERRRPQDGRLKMRSPGGREVEMRLSTMPTAFGEKCVMRLFDPDIVLKDYAQLGFSASEQAMWRHLVERPNGIVLVTGPTGSGTTTTLYTTLLNLAQPQVNVCTIEDPIEMVAPEINQMQVQPAIDLTFASGVRTLLRQDPDIIMIGEIRDLDTAQMAIQASLTGHLVLSTLHTNDAPSAVTRLIDLGTPHYLISSTLAGVIAQRLVRRLCAHCAKPGQVDVERWAYLTRGFARGMPEHARVAVGCAECRNTGYLGRVAIYEMLAIDGGLRASITAHADLVAFRAAAIAHGFLPLRVAAADKVAEGITTLAEVLTVLPPDA